MRVLWGLPWVGLVLCVPAIAGAQITVGDDPNDRGRAAIRTHQSFTLGNRDDGDRGGSLDVVPEYHTVERGDTLWDITGYYLANPWEWPLVWARNPQITNPHWIFPGDQVRLGVAGEMRARPAMGVTRQDHRRTASITGGRPVSHFSPGTLFMSEEAWATPDEIDAAGTIVGSPNDVMLLSAGSEAYIQFFHQEPHIGDNYTIYHESQATHGGDRNSGTVIRVLGTVIIDAWDRERQIATGRIIESLDSIERGERVTLIQRNFGPVPPVANTVNLTAHVVATPSPRTIVGAQYVVIVDRGSDDGVAVGNRFDLVHRGDPWQETMVETGQRRLPLDRDGDGNVDTPPDSNFPSGSNLPPEARGLMMVVAVHPRSSVCLVTRTSFEIEIGNAVVMRVGSSMADDAPARIGRH